MGRRATGVAAVREHIDTGSYRDQDRLPPEPKLAEKLGLTRAQLRTALAQLAKEGMIWRHVGKGTFIGAHPHSDAPATVMHSINPRELMEARLALEPRLARLAAVSASNHDLDQMDSCLEAARATDDRRQWQLMDLKLHRTIAQASRNSLLLELYQAINLPEHKDVWGRLKTRMLADELRLEYTAHHEDIVGAIRDPDPDDAERLMRTHLERVQQRLFSYTQADAAAIP